jgi:hypothetical protein
MRQFCRASTRGFRIKAMNPATTIKRTTSRSRYRSLPARKVSATTATAVMIVASGIPRAAAASRRRARRVGTAVVTPADSFVGTPRSAESVLPGITVIA